MRSKLRIREGTNFLDDCARAGENPKDTLIGAIVDTGGNVKAAAQRLRLPRSTMYYHLKQLGITREAQVVRDEVRNRFRLA